MIQSLLLFTAIFIFSVELHSTTLQKASPEVINGHTLPPEPDPTINNATLLGVDSNNNGVRDDVERWIVKQFVNAPKVAIEVKFQIVRAYQKVIENPGNAHETYKVLDAALDCESAFVVDIYAKILHLPHIPELDVINLKHFKSKFLNTRERIQAFLQHDLALSGGGYDSTSINDLKSKCNFDVDTLIGGE